jgi:soluble lytic murein transglycosylase-like protein
MLNKEWYILYVLIIWAGTCAVAHADIYQFVDDSGVVHFTNVPAGRVKKNAKVHAEARIASPSTASSQAALPATGNQRSDEIPASYLNIINSACERYGVDPSLVHAVVKVESGFNPFAVSRKGAMGLMQLMPQTASIMKVSNTFSPHENVEGGVKYLRYLLDRYEGNLSLALAAYNSGETAVKKWGTVPPFKETQDYVKKIMQIYYGTGKTGADGTILLTDNPSNHPDKKLHRKMEKNL